MKKYDILIKLKFTLISNYIIGKNYQKLMRCWEEKIKITLKDLEYKSPNNIKEVEVFHKKDLAEHYLQKFVSYSELLDDTNILIIKKNHSVKLICGNITVGAVIRNAAKASVLKHFGAKMKVTVDAHYPLNRGGEHRSTGTMAAHGYRPNRTKTPSFKYKYNENLSFNTEEIYDNDGNTLAKWLFENSKYHLSFATSSYEDFKNQVKLNDDEPIGAVFCTKNYEAEGHIDKDRSKYAIGYVYEEGTVEEGYFFYPEYGVAIEMASNSIWCWLPKSVHGTTKLNLSKGGTRYTAVISLTEKTAKSIEKKSR